MNIPHYSAMLYNGKTIEIGGDEDTEPLIVQPPSADEAEVGYMNGVTATETVELHRALSAWLGMHERLHRGWHAEYRKRNPGGRRQ